MTYINEVDRQASMRAQTSRKVCKLTDKTTGTQTHIITDRQARQVKQTGLTGREAGRLSDKHTDRKADIIQACRKTN